MRRLRKHALNILLCLLWAGMALSLVTSRVEEAAGELQPTILSNGSAYTNFGFPQNVE
ncbi:MAG: hypothetical protein KJO82_07540 [Gammaproteobacteria bacterium]|nr:hypothetical protein [Gammaproteobacteria bacterium]